MASEQLPVKVVCAPAALDDLQGIWEWNSERYGTSHADAYLQFLQDKIDQLGTDPYFGRQVPDRPNLRYFLVKRRAKGHGHVVVFQRMHNRIDVLHVFHTAQDWRKKIR